MKTREDRQEGSTILREFFCKKKMHGWKKDELCTSYGSNGKDARDFLLFFGHE